MNPKKSLRNKHAQNQLRHELAEHELAQKHKELSISTVGTAITTMAFISSQSAAPEWRSRRSRHSIGI
ncbi:hypothetical protein EVAR_36735_1 [Eumeta japonica]|uniref:Uncharacterized protein n=1 Tax=Eumeta variegata TaxID=151549 RepID=A0A4C1WZY6_EUMVA|nr:hypothetical protein EVAR_36735_1 [Eumeta japonica]